MGDNLTNIVEVKSVIFTNCPLNGAVKGAPGPVSYIMEVGGGRSLAVIDRDRVVGLQAWFPGVTH